MTTADGGGAQDDASQDPTALGARERRVIEPDLLWIKGVTERLLGTAGRAASWERVDPEGRRDEGDDEATPSPAVEAGKPTSAQQMYVQPAEIAPEQAFRPVDPRQQIGRSGRPAEPLPRREARDFDGPVSYRQPPAYVPAAPILEAPEIPAYASPERAEPAADQDMQPTVLRAALRDALPDDFGVGGPGGLGPADAVFGDPRWNLPPEDDEPTSYLPSAAETQLPAAAVSAEGSLYAAALAADLAAESGEPPTPLAGLPRPEPATIPEPLRPQPTVIAPDALLEAEAAAVAAVETTDTPEDAMVDLLPDAPAVERAPDAVVGEAPTPGYPRPADQLDAGDVALRRAFLSGDRELAEAVVRLVGEQSADRQRARMALAYLDALLDEGGRALPGAARLRTVLDD